MRAAWGTTLLGIVLFIGPARAADVEFSITARETYVGLPVQIQVAVKNAQDHKPPEPPEIDGADVRIGNPSQSTFTSIVNGRVERTISTTYTIAVIPRRAGILHIPAIRVEADGEIRESSPTTIRVRESSNDGLLYVEIVSERDSVYVGEPIDVTLEIWLKPFDDGRVTLDQQEMWRCVDGRNSAFGPFAEVIDSGQVRVRSDARRDDRGALQSYYVYLLNHKLWPERPGVFDASGVNIVANYPLELRRNRFSIFAPENQVISSRPVTAGVGEVAISVNSPPTQGRPPNYRGAVGQYTMDVSAAPAEVAVGDPITLNIAIRGTGRLDLLQPPPLTDQSALTTDFRVPDEPLAGELAGTVKKFSQSIRAKSESVTRIPPIAFAYFDPETETYRTIESDPIPITVRESDRMAVQHITESGPRTAARTDLTLLDQGMWANYEDLPELLVQQTVRPDRRVWTFATAAPLLYLAVFFIARHQQRLRGDTAFARRRTARRTAIGRIDRAARSHDLDPAAGVTAALTGYVADRCNLPAGAVTRTDAVTQLQRRAVTDDLVREIDDVLAQCESARYAGGAEGSSNDIVSRAKRCIDQLERVQL